jgi:UDP-N-acetyl-D-galactosamine dehydrogenase
MNEVAIISNLVGIDTKEVIDAASTKWNFIPMRPGLVGGHCIGVVPYYLTYKAEMLGYHPDVILAGRRINDGMGKYIADQTVKQMIKAGVVINGAKVCIFGLAFKENVQDLSNSKIVDTVKELESFGVEVIVYDPVVKPQMAHSVYGIELIEWDDLPMVDAIIFAISHDEFMAMPIAQLTSKLRSHGCFIDIQSVISRTALEDSGFSVWRL